MSNSSNVPAKRDQEIVQQEQTLTALVKRYEGNIRDALPEHIKPERMLSIIRTAITSNPGLRRCSPMSVIAGLVAASRLGLESDGVLGEAYLIPRWNKNTKHMEASFQLGYQGKVKLTYQSGEVLIVRSRLVHEKDHFEFSFEPEPKLIHKPCLKGDRGAVVCAYVYIKYKNGQVDIFEPMPVEEAFKIRDTYGPKNEAGELVGPWVTNTEEMIRKTALHRAWKWLPKSVEMKDAMRYEARIEGQGESPELVVLDIPVDEIDSAEVGAATGAAKERLKTELEKKSSGRRGGKATGEGEASPGTSGPAPDGGTTDRPATGSATAPTAQETQPADPKQAQVLEVKDLPDALDEKFAAHAVLRWKGVPYQRNESNTAWREVQEDPAAAAAPTKATGLTSVGQILHQLDFGGQEKPK